MKSIILNLQPPKKYPSIKGGEKLSLHNDSGIKFIPSIR